MISVKVRTMPVDIFNTFLINLKVVLFRLVSITTDSACTVCINRIKMQRQYDE